MMSLEPRRMVAVPLTNFVAACEHCNALTAEFHTHTYEIDHFLPKEALEQIERFTTITFDMRTARPSESDPDVIEVEYPFVATRPALAELLRPAPDAKPLFDCAEVMVVSRQRSERGLDPDRQPLLSSFAVSEQEAFAELLRLSGLDEHEIAAYDLTSERLGGPAGLIEELKAITGDDYDITVHEFTLPLRPSVKGQLQE